MRPRILGIIGLGVSVVLGVSAQAIPALQLGPGTGNWVYDSTTETWVTDDDPLNLRATANATRPNGGNGAYAWNGGTSRYAYLVVAAVPQIASTEPPSLFDITLENDGGALALYTSGYGNAPIQDTNDLPSHGIFDTYFEIYEFNFDGPIVTISDTQPGTTGTGAGYEEFFDITINSLSSGVRQLHFDLFTVRGSGHLNLSATPSNNVVHAFAPFSHDAQAIPEPGAVAAFSIGLLVAGMLVRRFGRRED